jgi:glycosyltransferase involved in cell wall biosynthesis
MCVHNGERTVCSAIKSIQQQTFKDYEFVILDDGSTDCTLSILKKHESHDSRIKVYHQKNTGLTTALNNAIKFAHGRLIARQDADDTSHPSRLEKQVAYLEQNERVLLLGCNFFEEINGQRYLGKSLSNEIIMKSVFLQNPFPHTSAMFRRSVFNQLGGYDESFDTSQDFELWIRFAKLGQIAMLDEPLVTRVVTLGGVSNKRRFRQYINSARARLMHSRYGFAVALWATLYQVIAGFIPFRLIAIKRLIYRRATNPFVSIDQS